MRQVEYIIVGLGLAGIAFCEQLEKAGKSYMVYDHQRSGASRIAAGLYNPVILKRYTLPWKSIEQFDLALPFFKSLEAKLRLNIIKPMPVRKLFSSIEDQNNWFTASDKPGLDRFVKASITYNENTAINAPYQCGEVLETGRIAIKELQQAYQIYLEGKNAFAKADFTHLNIKFQKETVTYDDLVAKHIVFAEGYGMKNNPYFGALPLVGNKGEYIIIKAPKLKLTAALKTSFFIVPLGNDLYKVGATFNWTDKDTITTQEAKEELIDKLSGVIQCDYEIIAQEAGIRPTTGDRRALVGIHPKFTQLALLNGLGTRGIMASPLLAKYLYNHIENGVDLPPEIDIKRFPKKF